MFIVLVLNTWNYFAATNRSGGDLEAFSLSLTQYLSFCPHPLLDLICSFPCLLLIVPFILVLYWLPRTHSETSENTLTIPLRCNSVVWFIHGSLSAWLLYVFFYFFKWGHAQKLPTNDRPRIYIYLYIEIERWMDRWIDWCYCCSAVKIRNVF